MKKIPLSQGKFALVDDADYDWLNQWKWYAHKSKNVFYASRAMPALDTKGLRKYIKMHRIILGIVDSRILADHKDRNGLNNQRSNLRIATLSQNGANRKSWGSSKYLGVSFHKTEKVWQAAIRKDGVDFYLGRFKTERDAAIAYNKKATKLHGNFARLNKVT